MIELVKERRRLAKESEQLQSLALDKKNKYSNETKELQNKVYKKFKFCDELLKASRKVNGGKNGN